ncbi:hypothetical protein [Peribacillus sp. NPDC058076]|uniref:hypothetical protein n=1 Tax=Peribacillus sp. NPDC058076 TaxID=3346329 RepID=UPI0036DDBAA2
MELGPIKWRKAELMVSFKIFMPIVTIPHYFLPEKFESLLFKRFSKYKVSSVAYEIKE